MDLTAAGLTAGILHRRGLLLHPYQIDEVTFFAYYRAERTAAL